MTETKNAAGTGIPGGADSATPLRATPHATGEARHPGMNRNAATRLVERSRLNSGERAVMHALLRRADNRTCEIPDRFAPERLEELALCAGLSERQTRRVLRHLELHGWLSVESGLGRGNKTGGYRLFPRTPDEKCSCPRGAEKRGHGVRFSEGEKMGHPSPEKGSWCPIKADMRVEVSAGQTDFSIEGNEGEGRALDAKAGYGTTAPVDSDGDPSEPDEPPFWPVWKGGGPDLWEEYK